MKWRVFSQKRRIDTPQPSIDRCPAPGTAHTYVYLNCVSLMPCFGASAWRQWARPMGGSSISAMCA